ncbi:MAG: homoserine dehydrogenase [Candidatus Tokpelaia sp. JSC188]|nr:MAG: homoserine dehydrogenase [Candidatus Tokpelaia sp. JSC188]
MSEALRIGIAGLGTVGSAVVRLFVEKAEMLIRQCRCPLQIVAVSARHRRRERNINLDSFIWYDNPEELAASADINVFIELIGGESGSAYRAVKLALEAGRHVVTANKALLAHHGVELAQLAESKGLLLNFEAAVAGGIPVIKILRESLSGSKTSRVYGILNGTCNYILTQMEEKELSFQECLKNAQDLGYAEADPSFDIEGNDTAHKLALLTSLAFGTVISLDNIYVEGIRNISLVDIRTADELGCRIKLLGVAVKTNTGIEQRVHPIMVPTSSAIAQVKGVTNAVAIETDLLGELFLSGAGAGGNATASAVIADIADIAKSHPGFQHGPVFGIPANTLKPYTKSKTRAHTGGYFIRLSVQDRIGTFSSLTKRMAENDISLESIVQRPAAETQTMHESKTVVLITHQTTEATLRKALTAITQDGNLIDKAQMIRIERYC